MRYVPVDFETDSLPGALTAAGLDRDRRSCVVWEGVFSYLTPAAIDRTLEAHVQVSGPGSQIPRGGCHAGAPAFFTNSSYPLVSSSSASSAPPCLTIRPPTKTCTKSGFTYRRIRV